MLTINEAKELLELRQLVKDGETGLTRLNNMYEMIDWTKEKPSAKQEIEGDLLKSQILVMINQIKLTGLENRLAKEGIEGGLTLDEIREDKPRESKRVDEVKTEPRSEELPDTGRRKRSKPRRKTKTRDSDIEEVGLYDD